jgi:hypothetical protein
VVKPGAENVWPEILKDLGRFADWFDEHLKRRGETSDKAPDAVITAPEVRNHFNERATVGMTVRANKDGTHRK